MNNAFYLQRVVMMLLLCLLANTITGCISESQYRYDVVFNRTILDSVTQVLVRYSTDRFTDSIIVAPVRSGSILSVRSRGGIFADIQSGIYGPFYRSDSSIAGLQVHLMSLPYSGSKSPELYLGERLRSLYIQIDNDIVYSVNYEREKGRGTDWQSLMNTPKKSNVQYWESSLYLGFNEVNAQIIVANETNATFRVQYSANIPSLGRVDSTVIVRLFNQTTLLDFTYSTPKFDKNFIQNMNDYVQNIRITNIRNDEVVYERNQVTKPIAQEEWRYFYMPPPRQTVQYIYTIRR